jgi:hypothetical protein
MAKYLRYKPGMSANHIEKYVLHFRESIDWVDDIKEATSDYLISIEATNVRVKNELGLETTLVELPDKLGGESMWVIRRED